MRTRFVQYGALYGICLLSLAYSLYFHTRYRAALPAVPEPRLDLSTCVFVGFERFARTGNNLVQLMHLHQLLDICTGAAIPLFKSNEDDVFAIPDIIAVGTYTANTLALIRQNCTAIKLGRELYHTRTLAKALRGVPCYKRILSKRKFPPKGRPEPRFLFAMNYLLRRDAYVDTIDLSSTAVAHIRGGDVFRENYSFAAWYTQPPCSYYYEAFRHSKASKLLIVTDDRANPCIELLARNISGLILEVGGSTIRAFNLLRKATYLISTRSTFSQAAVSFAISPNRTVYVATNLRGITLTSPRYGYAGGTVVCKVRYDTKGMEPWTASKRQIHYVKSRKSKVLGCKKL